MKIVFTPDWFLNFDVLIESFGFMILGLLFLFAIQAYTISKKKSTLYLGFGFLLIALGELSTVFTKLILYYDSSVTSGIGEAIISKGILNSVDIFYYTGFSIHRFLILLGLYVLYKLPDIRKRSDPADWALAIYWIFITVILSHSIPYLYHLTALIILSLIIRDYVRIYSDKKSKNTRILISAFGLLALSQGIFIFSPLGSLYVLAQGLQVASYMILLTLIVKIVQNGKKAKPDGNHA